MSGAQQLMFNYSFRIVLNQTDKVMSGVLLVGEVLVRIFVFVN